MIGIYSIEIKNIGSYIDSSVNIDLTYTNHLELLSKQIHHCYKLQYIYNELGLDFFQLKILLQLNNVSMLEFSNLTIRAKYRFILNSRYPIKFKKYDTNIIIEKPSKSICIIKRYYDRIILGMEINENLEPGHYSNKLERLE